MKVQAFDHIVLVCTDVERTLCWYLETLGLGAVRVDEWRRGEAPFPSVRVSEDTVIDLLARRDSEPGEPSELGAGRLDHLCVVIEPTDLDELVRSGRFDIVDGPGPRFGARGIGTSLYVRDPDGTVVELRYY